MKKIILLIICFIVLVISSAYAKDENVYSGKVHNQKTTGVERTFNGELVCLGCDLKENGARSECKIRGHNIRLKTQNGTYLTILPNKYSEKLLSDTSMMHQPITVKGFHFAKANMIDLTSYAIGDKIISWCTVHQTMDTCSQKQ